MEIRPDDWHQYGQQYGEDRRDHVTLSENGQFVVAHVDFTNSSKAHATFSTTDSTMYDSAGREFMIETLYTNRDSKDGEETIQPGASGQTNLIFEYLLRCERFSAWM